MIKKLKLNSLGASFIKLIFSGISLLSAFWAKDYLWCVPEDNIFEKRPLIKVSYISPDDPESGFKSIEGINPEDNSVLFKLDFISSFKSSDYSIHNFRFSTKSGNLTLWSKYERNGFYHDYLGDRRLTTEWKKEERVRKYRILLDGKKKVEIPLSDEEDHPIILEPAVVKNLSIDLASFSEELRDTSFENILAEFVWAHSFMPENNASSLAVDAGILFGVVSVPHDSPFFEYTRCVESACEDCGGDWGQKPFGMVGCIVPREREDTTLKLLWRNTVLTLCFVANSAFCLKYLPSPK